MQVLKNHPSFLGSLIGAVVALVILAPLTSYLIDQAEKNVLSNQRNVLLARATTLRAKIEGELSLTLALSKGVEAPYAIKGTLGAAEFNALAAELLAKTPFVKNIGLTKGTVFTNVYPLAGNEGLVGVDYQKIPKQWPKVEKAIETRHSVIDGPLNLIQGGVGLIQRTPVYKSGEGTLGNFLGIVSIVIDVEKMLAPFEEEGVKFAIRKDGAQKPFWGDTELFSQNNTGYISEIVLPDGVWQLATSLTGRWVEESYAKLSRIKSFIIGIVVLLIALSCYLGFLVASKRSLYGEFKLKQKQYLDLLINAPDAMLFVNQKGEIIKANDKAHELFEYEAGTLEGLNVDALLQEDQRSAHRVKRKTFAKAGVPRDMSRGRTLEIYTHKNNKRYVEINLGISGKNEDQIITATVRDVTSRVMLEKERNLAEEILREALEAIPDGFVIYDAEDRLVICNSAYKKIYEASSPAMVPGAKFEDIIRYGVANNQYPAAGDTDEAKEEWIRQRVAQHINPSEVILQFTDKGRWLKIDERKTVSGHIVGVRTDVTDIKEKEEKLKEQAKELKKLAHESHVARELAEKADRAKSDFLAIISHELRTPMTGILGLSDLLLVSDLDEIQKTHLKNLHISAETLLSLLNNILDYSKFEAGHLNFEAVAFDLCDVVDGVLQLLGPVASQKGVNLVSRIEGDDKDYFFRSDPVRLRQVLLNLTSNAIKFTKQGSVSIIVKPLSNEGCLRVEVHDTGTGIPNELGDKLFKPFTQADESTTRKFGGTGLGLAICRKIVEGLGGEIDFESTLGEGSIFWFELSLEKTDHADIEKSDLALSKIDRSRVSYTRALSILLAEDNQINRTVISTVLKRMGHGVDEATNGAEAVEKAKHNEYDLILMDMQMPEMDGCEATIQIRQEKGPIGQTPIIALTADVQAENNKRYREAGISVFVTKPVDWEVLQQKIDKLFLGE